MTSLPEGALRSRGKATLDAHSRSCWAIFSSGKNQVNLCRKSRQKTAHPKSSRPPIADSESSRRASGISQRSLDFGPNWIHIGTWTLSWKTHLKMCSRMKNCKYCSNRDGFKNRFTGDGSKFQKVMFSEEGFNVVIVHPGHIPHSLQVFGSTFIHSVHCCPSTGIKMSEFRHRGLATAQFRNGLPPVATLSALCPSSTWCTNWFTNC